MNTAERQKIDDICNEIFMSIDEIGARSPEKLTDDIIRDTRRPDLATQSEVVEETTAEIKNLQDELNALNDHVETIQDMIVSPADGDKGFVEDEARTVEYIRGNMQVIFKVLLDIAELNSLDENNNTLNMIDENVQYACAAIGHLVNELYKAYER